MMVKYQADVLFFANFHRAKVVARAKDAFWPFSHRHDNRRSWKNNRRKCVGKDWHRTGKVNIHQYG